MEVCQETEEADVAAAAVEAADEAGETLEVLDAAADGVGIRQVGGGAAAGDAGAPKQELKK